MAKYFEFLGKNVNVSERYANICEEVGINAKKWIVEARAWFFITFLASLFIFILFKEAFFLFILPFLVYIVIEEWPKFKYRTMLLEELNEVPVFFGQLVMLLKRNPNLEVALQELARGEGKLSKLIAKEVWELTTAKKSAKKILENIANRYGIDEMKFGVYTILSSFSSKNREELLDRGLNSIVLGIRKKIDEIMNSIITPTLFIFSFATTIPLLLITLVPILSVLMHVGIRLPLIASILIVSLLSIYTYMKYVESSYPDFMPKAKRKFDLLTKNPFVSLGPAFIGVIFFLLLPDIYAYVSLGVGISISFIAYIYGSYHLSEEQNAKLIELERDSTNKLYQMALQIEEGRPLENVVGYLPAGPFTDLMKVVVKRVKEYHVSLREAIGFVSSKIKGTNLKMVFDSMQRLARAGSSMAETLKLASQHLHTVNEIREEVKNKIANLTQMTQITGMIFVPIVGAMVITFYRMIVKGLELATEFFVKVNINIGQLVLVVLLYSISLSYILLDFAYKFDVKRKTKVAYGLLISTFIFVVTLIISYSLA